MRAKLIYEAIEFERGRDPKRSLNIGIPFGFTKQLKGLEYNDGENSMWVTKEFGDKFLYKISRSNSYYLEDGFYGTWGHNYYTRGGYICNYKFKGSSSYPNLLKVQGLSGSYGFGGLESTKATLLSKKDRKELYKQLWDHLMKLWMNNKTNESLDFERGKDPKNSMEIGLYKNFESLEDGISYIISMIPNILGTKEIPKDIVFDEYSKNYFPADYYDKIREYSDRYLRVDGKPLPINSGTDWETELWATLINMGYRVDQEKWEEENLNESLDFKRGQDPKETMKIGVDIPEGIGLKELERYEKLDMDFRRDFSDFIWGSMGFYNRMQDENGRITINISDKAKVEYTSPYKKRKIKAWFKKNHPYFRVKSLKYENTGPYSIAPYLTIEYIDDTNESIDFERGQDPKRAMGLGIVKVKGDRGIGDYEVRLIEPYEGSDKEDEEEIWKVEIVSGQRPGKYTYVIKYEDDHILKDKGYWGELDPFVAMSESIGFQRGKDPKNTLGIGNISRRDFENVDEITEWAYLYPEVWSEGAIEKWDDSDRIIYRKYAWGTTMTVPRFSDRKLRTIKWIRDNITINGESLTLKESKDIVDGIEFKLLEEIQKRDSLKESVEFQRGKDPKRAMNIGVIAKINNAIEDDDTLDDIISEMDEELGAAMEVYLPVDKKKEIARMWLSNKYESLPNYMFKVIYQSDDDYEEPYDKFGDPIEPINYEIADLEAEGWKVFHEEDNFGDIQVILYKEV